MARPEISLAGLQSQFHEIVGFMPPDPISETYARVAAERVVMLEEKLQLHTEQSSDLYIAMISASQLIAWWKKTSLDVYNGNRPHLIDTSLTDHIADKFSKGNLPPEELKRLTALKYIAVPNLGATVAVEVFEKLRTKFPNMPLTDTTTSRGDESESFV